jgi:hypothetical protein
MNMSDQAGLQELNKVTQELATELAIPQEAQVAKYTVEEEFDKFVSSYLPRLQLFDSNSNACKQGLMQIGEYGLVQNNNHIPLGKEVKCWILSMRFKAMDINDGVKSYFNPKNPEFVRIMGKSSVQNTGCLCGPEFLVYLPDQDKFATFYMSSKTMRREAQNVKPLRNKACLLRTRLIEKKPYSWWGAVATTCTTPLQAPPNDRLQEELQKFNNPPETEVEKITDEEKAALADRER